MAGNQQGVVIIGGGIMGGDIAIIFAAGNWNVHVMSPSEKTRSSLPARHQNRPQETRRAGDRGSARENLREP